MNKKLIAVMAVASVLVLALAGCASGSGSAASKSASASSASASASASASSASASASSASASAASVGMPNPWSDAASAEEAAKGAGLDTFSVPEGVKISLGEVPAATYSYMDGIAQAKIEFPAVEMTIRKGKASAAAEEGDISGDYTEYANTWTQNIKGLEITCFGNREGDATKTIFKVDDTCYSINVLGLGGDTDYGLKAEDLQSLIMALQ